MRIKIVDEPVRHNVELFLDILRRVKEKQVPKTLPPEKVFRAWLHRETGQFFFDEIMKESLALGKKEWKPISFSYRYDPVSGEIQFLLEESDTKEAGFNAQDLAPVAYRILRETMKTFNEISTKLKGPSDLETKISVLAKLNIEAEVSHADRSVLIDTWHHADRMQAESLLIEKPVGTYLFRKDSFADILEEQLEHEHGCKVKCFTLTYSKGNRQICDCTLVHVGGAWQIYNDDPSLEQKKFADLEDLIASLRSDLKYPLYH